MLVNRGPEKGLAEDSAHRKRSDGLDLKFDKWICANGSVQSATNLSAESINTFWGGKRFGPPIPHHEFSTVPGVTLLHYNYQCVFITQERLLPKYEYSHRDASTQPSNTRSLLPPSLSPSCSGDFWSALKLISDLMGAG